MSTVSIDLSDLSTISSSTINVPFSFTQDLECIIAQKKGINEGYN